MIVDVVARESETSSKLLSYIEIITYADVAELVDALASGASVRKYVEVQVLSSAPKIRGIVETWCFFVG